MLSAEMKGDAGALLLFIILILETGNWQGVADIYWCYFAPANI